MMLDVRYSHLAPKIGRSVAYRRVVEDLVPYVERQRLHKLLEHALERVGATPASAESYDFRLALEDGLAAMLAPFIEGGSRGAIALVERVLVELHMPRETSGDAAHLERVLLQASA